MAELGAADGKAGDSHNAGREWQASSHKRKKGLVAACPLEGLVSRSLFLKGTSKNCLF
jgi:hypothetical protein